MRPDGVLTPAVRSPVYGPISPVFLLETFKKINKVKYWSEVAKNVVALDDEDLRRDATGRLIVLGSKGVSKRIVPFATLHPYYVHFKGQVEILLRVIDAIEHAKDAQNTLKEMETRIDKHLDELKKLSKQIDAASGDLKRWELVKSRIVGYCQRLEVNLVRTAPAMIRYHLPKLLQYLMETEFAIRRLHKEVDDRCRFLVDGLAMIKSEMHLLRLLEKKYEARKESLANRKNSVSTILQMSLQEDEALLDFENKNIRALESEIKSIEKRILEYVRQADEVKTIDCSDIIPLVYSKLSS